MHGSSMCVPLFTKPMLAQESAAGRAAAAAELE